VSVQRRPDEITQVWDGSQPPGDSPADSRPWPYLVIIAVGVVISLAASNRTPGLIIPLIWRALSPANSALADPRALWHLVGVIAGLALIGTGTILWGLGRRAPAAPLPTHTPSKPPPRPSRSPALPPTMLPMRIPSRHDMLPVLALTNDAQTTEETGEYEQAGELYDRRHDDGAAARAYAKAALQAEAGSPERASLVNRCLNRARQAGNDQIAAELLADIGEIWQAIDLARASGNARMTAALMQRAGDHAGAAGVLAAAGDAAGAAQVMVDAGNVQGAIEFLAVEDPAAGAKLAADQCDFDRAVELYVKAGLPGEAAALLFEEKPKRAGELFLQAGNFISAADCFEHSGAKSEAAQAWLWAEKPERAAPLLEALGDHAGLARCRELEGDFIAATRLLLRLGRPEEAHKMLGRLPVEALQAPAPSLLAANCLMQTGRVDEAIPILHGVRQHEQLEEALQCETCYLLGVAYLGKQQTAQAASFLYQVTLLNPEYRAARRLLARLGK
jgi:tetratricopeptide (TPR) repeat protein